MITDPPSRSIPTLLTAIDAGDSRASAEMLPLVYEELRALARTQLAQEGAGLTLQPTALVHEAYLRLIGGRGQRWDSVGHFFAAAATAIRRILVERARRVRAIRHGGGVRRLPIEDESVLVEGTRHDVVLLDDVLSRLEQADPRKSEVVMLRHFAGLTIEQTARAMGLSHATVEREWTYARAWLLRELESLAPRHSRGAS